MEDELEEGLPLGRDEGESAGGQAQDDDEKRRDSDDHDEVIRNWAGGILRVDAQEAKDGEDRPAEDLVEQDGDVNGVL